MQCPSSMRGSIAPSATAAAQRMIHSACTSRAQSQCKSAALPCSRTTHWHANPALGKSTRIARAPLHMVASTTGVTTPATQRTFPVFMPKEVEDIKETVALDMAARMQRVPVNVPCMAREVNTAFVGPATRPSPLTGVASQLPPIVLVPSFDSSILEFRRLFPLLEAKQESWAVDVAGWGFTDAGFAEDKNTALGPQEKREHLYSFWKQQVKRPMVLLGTSLGGTIALDFALAYPEAVEKLVLVDAQGFIDGIGPMSKAPRFVASLGVQLLKTNTLRQMANQMAYYDKSFATEDAMRCGRLHTYLPGWLDANVAFIQSGGYSLSKRVSELKPDVLILWGRHDEILSPSYAEQFAQALPESTLRYMESSGHSAHLEEPQAMADVLFEFLGQ